MKFAAYILTAIFIATSVEAATPVVTTLGSNDQICHIGGNVSPAAYGKLVKDPCGMDLINPRTRLPYIGFQLPAMRRGTGFDGISFSPILLSDGYYFVKNVTDNTYFVPANSKRELDQFANKVKTGNLPGVMLIGSSPVYNFPADDLCGGKIFKTGRFTRFDEGANVLNFGKVGIDNQVLYSSYDQNGHELRRFIATATRARWDVQPLGTCPNDNATPGQLNDLDTAAGNPTFNRNGPTVQQPTQRNFNARPQAVVVPQAVQPQVLAATPQAQPVQQRVAINDGASVRNITPQSQPQTRVFVTDGALVRNIR